MIYYMFVFFRWQILAWHSASVSVPKINVALVHPEIWWLKPHFALFVGGICWGSIPMFRGSIPMFRHRIHIIFFCWSNMYPIISPRLPFPYKFWNDILIYSWFPEENPINHHFPRRFPQLFTPGRSAHPKTLWTSPRTSPSVWWLACGSRSFNLASLW